MKKQLPQVTFKTRVLGDQLTGEYVWEDVNSTELFENKRVIIFSLPGAFTPTCSNQQLPTFEEKYEEFKSLGIDEVYCISVNDSFVMNAWFKSQGIENVKPIPDGSGEFTDAMDMLVDKSNLGFGKRSWRYAVFANNNEIEIVFEEPGKVGNFPTDPYTVTDPNFILKILTEGIQRHEEQQEELVDN